MLVALPILPVLLEPVVRNPFIFPAVAAPVAVAIIVSPPQVHIKVKTRNGVIINPVTVIVTRAIPAPLPRTPPPTVPEVNVHIDIRDNIHVHCIGYHNHLRRRLKDDERRKGYPDTYIDLGNRRNRRNHYEHQKYCGPH